MKSRKGETDFGHMPYLVRLIIMLITIGVLLGFAILLWQKGIFPRIIGFFR